MKIEIIRPSVNIYSSNVYYVYGDWKTLDDVNTLIDVGSDYNMISKIENLPKGAGKKLIDQVIITHSHFDHTMNLKVIKEKFNPKVYAYSKGSEIDYLFSNEKNFKIGDSYFEIIHAPVHSSDSILLYCSKEKVLFSGDTQLNIKSVGGSYSKEFLNILEYLLSIEINYIYPGHGEIFSENIKEMILETYKNVKNSNLI